MKTLLLTLAIIITTNLYSQVDIEWETNLGGSSTDVPADVKQTTDGGYIVAGHSYSNDGDVGGNNSDFADYWIVKLSTSGDLEWENNLGGIANDFALSIQQTMDEGYIVAGFSESNDGDVGGNNGDRDYWIVKLDTNGDLLWENNLGGSGSDTAVSIEQLTDGSYIVAGYSNSNNGDVSGNNGSYDYWIVKLDTSGNLVWETSLGGNSLEFLYSMEQTTDGGYIIGGASLSSNGDVGGNNGNFDYWIVKIDANGNLLWETNLGGSDRDYANAAQETSDGGYIVAGYSESSNGDVGGNYGGYDYWIVKLDINGVLVWETNLGGSSTDFLSSAQQTTDGGFAFFGWSSSNDGDVGGNNGSSDYWIVKTDANGNLDWESNFGGSSTEFGSEAKQTPDGGYILVGYSESNNGDVGGNNGGRDYWIMKLSLTLGLEDILSKNISLSPNPATNTISISNLPQEVTKLEVVDMQGRVVLTQTKIQNNTLDISKLQAATYLVKIYSGKSIFVKKIIKK